MIGDKNKPGQPVRLNLFIADGEMNSRIAEKNLQSLIKDLEEDTCQIEIIDVFTSPEKALQKGIFITPALEISGENDSRMIYGDLSNLSDLESVFPLDKW